jgi:PPOX class probable F420-dependent enzyme
MDQEQRRAFVRSHRTAIYGFNRKNDGPAMSVVYYLMDGDDILISTMEGRGKAKAIRRNPKVSLCVLDEKWPLTYLQVYGEATIDATVDTDLEKVTDLLMRILGLMAGKPMPESVREQTRHMALAERRVQLRVRPYATFESPPRHVYSSEDVAGLTHDLGQHLPWK